MRHRIFTRLRTAAAGALTLGLVATAWAPTSAQAATAKTVVVKTYAGALGTYLTNSSGRTLYLWVADAKNESSCTAVCATYWPPLIGKPKAGGLVKQAGLGTIKRADGRTQVTYHGHPLYYFAGDKGPGVASGQGSLGSGAKWWVVSAAGKAITKKAPATVVITTHKGPLGTYLTNKAGRAIYLWVADPKNQSECTSTCATYWPPVTGSPLAAGLVKQAGLGVLTRANGKKQITYHGHALYYFAGDTGPDSTTGQGSLGSGAKWWLVNAAGKPITKS